jgi:hypothetical protein
MAAVTLGALIQRIARKLAHEGEKLYVNSDPGQWRHDLVNYYITDERNVVTC